MKTQIAEKNPVAVANRLVKAGQYNEAWEVLVAYREEIPSNLAACMVGVCALHKGGKLDQALRRAIWWIENRSSQDVNVLRAAGVLLIEMGKQTPKALSYLEQAQAILPDAGIAKLIEEVKEKCHGQKTASQFKLPGLFHDYSDLASFTVLIVHTVLIAIFFIAPFVGQIGQHPVWGILSHTTTWLSTRELSAHVWWIVFVALLTVIAGMFMHRSPPHIPGEETVIFSQTRRVWAYPRWIYLSLFAAASLYLSSPSAALPEQLKVAAASLMGLVFITCLFSCLYLFLPGARTNVMVIQNRNEKANRLVVAQGIIWKKVKNYLPQMIDSAQVKIRPVWVLNYTADVHVLLTSGDTLRLIAPGSYLLAKILPVYINNASNAGKILPVNNGGNMHKASA